MNRAQELNHLCKADTDIGQARERITGQVELIERLSDHGHNTTAAQSLLDTMRCTLSVMEEHRRHIVRTLDSDTPALPER